MVLYVATHSLHNLLVTVASYTYTHKMCKLLLPHLLTRIFKMCHPQLVTYTFTTKWLPQIVTSAHSNTLQLNTGEEYFLLNVNNKGRKGRTIHLVTYNFLLDYTYCFIKTGSTLRGYLAAHNKKLRDQYGADTHELVPFHIFRSAVFLFWEEVLNINPKTGFVCPECGPRPKTLCCDGVAVGMQWEKIKDISDLDLVLPFNSPEILDAPHYKERMFIKLKKNRDMLKKCMDTENYPNFSKCDFSKEPNMIFVKNACEELKSQGYTTLPEAMSDIFHNLSSNSSTVSLFQVVDIKLMDQLKNNLFCKSSQLNIDQRCLGKSVCKTFSGTLQAHAWLVCGDMLLSREENLRI